MKGIVLAAGKGTRLYPMTKPVCKPLLPVYDKPLIYYPIAILMQAGISEILVIVPPNETATFTALLGDGSQYGLKISYAEQPVPLGDRGRPAHWAGVRGGRPGLSGAGGQHFLRPHLGSHPEKGCGQSRGRHSVRLLRGGPRPFGVVEFDKNGKAISIEEKPRYPKSNYIVPGLYFYDQQVMEIARALKPSARGELEITDVNLEYLSRGQLQVIPLEKNFTWLDAGTADSLLAAAQTIKEIQDTTGRYVGCLEELGFYEGWISEEQVHAIGDELEMTLYGKYLKCL